MGKKRKFARFIRWIRSDLPEENKSVLLLGVTKLPSPRENRKSRPHTLHLDHHLSAKSQTIDTLPYPRTKLPLLTKSRSNDSVISDAGLPDITIENPHFRDNLNGKCVDYHANKIKQNGSGNICEKIETKLGVISNEKCCKRVSFESDLNGGKVGFCTELPFEIYHPISHNPGIPQSNDVIAPPTGIMDKSVDSIGSCSLDVDASSTDFSDSSVESSNCTLRSLGIPTPIKEKSFQAFHTYAQTTNVETKKPSYLNLACTVNGYSNITNYDSKLRENFRIPRSREVSPIRPQDYHVNEPTYPQNKENSKYLTPRYNNYTSSPSKMTESKSHTVLQSGYTYSSSSTRNMTYMSQETRNFTNSMLYQDKVDGCMEKNGHLNSKFTSYETNKLKHSSYTNINEKEKSFSETMQENYYTNGQPNQNGTNKSFIQQRVERLYGPAALVQGFFINNKKKTRTDSENEQIKRQDNFPHFRSTNTSYYEQENDSSIKQSCSSPSLPVLRHLRPEFRAQLPILSPKRNIENTMQKSTTVPLSLTTVINGIEKKPLVNGSKSVESIENKENIQKKLIIEKSPKDHEIKKVESALNKIITEEIPAAPKVILPLAKSEVNGSDVNGNKNDLNDLEMYVNKPIEVKDGHYFLKILKNETVRLLKLAENIEEEMEHKKNLPDETLGYLRSASGKARLLVDQKMQQFEGLCHKNINQIPGEQFPTTAEDLQGFWDMVMLQVTQVDQLFADLDSYKANNWVIPEKPMPDAVDANKTKKIVVVKKVVSAKAEEQRKQREAARKKMIEDRRKAMKEKQQEKGIEIFIPGSS